MTKKEHRQFLTELINEVKKDLLNEVSSYPEEWDGVELRWRVRDVFSQVVWGEALDKRSNRYKYYKAHVTAHGLL